jgi:hypothetical protein
LIPRNLEVRRTRIAFALLPVVAALACNNTSSAGSAGMSGAREQAIHATFAERIADGELEGLAVVHSVTSRDQDGGSGQVTIRGDGTVTYSADDGNVVDGPALQVADLETFFDLLATGVSSLTPRSEARFPPDSAVGIITIIVDAKRAEFFYLADEGQRTSQRENLPDEISSALDRLDELRVQPLD